MKMTLTISDMADYYDVGDIMMLMGTKNVPWWKLVWCLIFRLPYAPLHIVVGHESRSTLIIEDLFTFQTRAVLDQWSKDAKLVGLA